MKIQKTREIIIEIERVQLIRKRAKTTLIHCEGCRTHADFVCLNEAAKLFDTTSELLFQFIQKTGSHYKIGIGNEIIICLESLLIVMRAETNRTARKQLQEKIYGRI